MPRPLRTPEKTMQAISEAESQHQFGLPARTLQYVLDGLTIISAFVLAYCLRFDFAVPEYMWERFLVQLPIVVLIQVAILRAMGVHSFIWRYIGLAEAATFARGAIIAAVPMLLLRYATPSSIAQVRIPLSVTLMDVTLAFGGLLGVRVVRRMVYERYEKQRNEEALGATTLKPVLLVGAGRAGVMAVKELLGRGNAGVKIVGFVDDDAEKQGSTIHGVRVVGRTADLPHLVREHGVDHVIITIACAKRDDLRRIVSVCEKIPVRVRIIPGLFELLEGRVEVSRARDVEIEDLLGRDPVQLDTDQLQSFLTDNTVMVTGGGGSIGSELCRQIARFQPSRLLLVERTEFALFTIDRELRASFPELEIVPLIADVGDHDRMEGIFRSFRPSVVLHAAAHKHVPLMEANPAEAAKNNTLATLDLAKLAGRYDVSVFVMISTDKAVNPTSVMGASKRVAELVIQDLDAQFDTRFVAVRFGNVLGSTGSVIPIFRDQIQRGGPVTITHPDMVRYFMTIPEAAQLVLQAGAMGEGGTIFVLDMGEPVRITDLAHDMITLSGLKPGEDIEVVFTGLRPGEKLFEELGADTEGLAKTKHPKIFIGRIERAPAQLLHDTLRDLRRAAATEDVEAIRAAFSRVVPEAKLGGQPA
ncbi:MAG: nucleoside-diphosphate sugar epimerase/dehydratase, partial [Myxococcota bacterium]